MAAEAEVCAWRILSVWQAGHIDCHDGIARPAPINRQDFGITGAPGVVSDEITITIDTELTQPAAK